MADRTCDKCGQTDSDPHHVQYVGFTHPVTGEAVDMSVTKHVDCCAEDGCTICGSDTAAAQTAGVAVKDFVQNRPTEQLQALFEQHGVETPDFQIPATSEAPA